MVLGLGVVVLVVLVLGLDYSGYVVNMYYFLVDFFFVNWYFLGKL